MVELLYLLVLFLVVVGLGTKLLSALGVRVPGFVEELVFAAGLGFGFLSYFVFALGISGLLRGYLIYGALGLVAVFCGREMLGLVRRFRSANDLVNLGEHPFVWLLAGTIGLAIALNFIGALAPISSADALYYHMAAPKYYAMERRIVPMPWEWPTYQPFNIEMLFLLGMLLRSDTLGALFHFLFGILLVLAIFPFCGRHFQSANPLLAAAIFYVGGLVAWESTSSFIDLGVTLFVLLSFMAFLNWFIEGGERWLVLSGIFGGLAAGSKFTGAIFPAIILLILIGYLLLEKRLEIRPLMSFSLPVLLLLAPWYLRNYFWTGNPVYPFLPGLFGTQDLNDPIFRAASRYGYGKDPLALLLAPFNLTFRGTGFDLGELISPLYLSLFPLSLFLSQERQVVRLIWIFSGIYFLVWFYTHQHARYLLFVLPLLAVACSSTAMALFRLSRGVKLVTASVLLAGISFGLATTAYYNAQFFPVVFGLRTRDDFLSQKTWYYPDIRWMNEHLPPDAKILVMGDAMPYYLNRRYVGLDGSLESALAKNHGSDGFDYIFCTGDCEIGLPGAEKVRESHASLVKRRTFGGSLGEIPTYVFRLPRSESR